MNRAVNTMYIPQKSLPSAKPPQDEEHTKRKTKKKHIKYSKYDNFKLHKKQEVTYSVKQDKKIIIRFKYH